MVAVALLAEGFGSDEEVFHYQTARHAPWHPLRFLSVGGRPLVTLFFTLPAQAGFTVARLAGVAASLVTLVAVMRAARRAGGRTMWAAAVCLLVQPYFVGYGSAVMTEPVAAAVLALGLVAFLERKPWWMAGWLALAPLARLEFALLLPAAVVVLVFWKRYGPLLLLPAGILVWNGLGALATGDALWLWHEAAPRAYPAREPLHYVASWVHVVGLGMFVPVAIAGVWALWPDPRRRGTAETPGERPSGTAARTTAAASAALVAFFVLMYTYFAVWRPVTFGNLRYLAFLAAPLALLALAGIDAVSRRRSPAVIAGLVLALAGAFLLWNREMTADALFTSRRSWLPAIAVGIWTVFALAVPARGRRFGWVLVAVLGIGGLLHTPRGLLDPEPDPEQEAVARAAELLAPEHPPVYAMHPLLVFHAGGDPFDPGTWPRTDRTVPAGAAPAALWFWDSHYTPIPGTDLELERVLADSTWRYAAGVASRDSTWAGAYFVRIVPGTDAPPWGDAVRGAGLDREAWRSAAELAVSGAASALRRAQADPGDPRRWHAVADRMAGLGRHAEALSALRRAEVADPDDPRTHTLRAFVHHSMGELDQAMLFSELALALDPNDAYTRFLNGLIHWDRGWLEEGRPRILGAAEELHDRPDVQILAGDLLFSEGSWEQARRHYIFALTRRPDHQKAGLRAAECAVRMGRPRLAEEGLGLLISVRPRDPLPYFMLGDLLAGQERRDEARRVYERGGRVTGDPRFDERAAALDER